MKFIVTVYPSELSITFGSADLALTCVSEFVGCKDIQLINIEQYEEETSFKVRDTRGHAGK